MHEKQRLRAESMAAAEMIPAGYISRSNDAIGNDSELTSLPAIVAATPPPALSCTLSTSMFGSRFGGVQASQRRNTPHRTDMTRGRAVGVFNGIRTADEMILPDVGLLDVDTPEYGDGMWDFLLT